MDLICRDDCGARGERDISRCGSKVGAITGVESGARRIDD
jgi:hypothetical protein